MGNRRKPTKSTKRKPGKCSKCRQNVRGHIGRPGPSCKNISLNIISDMATSGEPSNTTANTASTDNTEYTENVVDTSNFVAVTRGLQDIMESLSEQFHELRAEVHELRRGRETSEQGGRSMVQSQARRGGGSSSPEPPVLQLPTPIRRVMATGSGASSAAEHGQARPLQYDQLLGEDQNHVGLPFQPRPLVEGLRPVPRDADLRGLSLPDGISETTVRSALMGEFQNLDLMLSNFIVNFRSDNNVELLTTGEGSVICKPRVGRRAVYNFNSWDEAWTNYTKIMVGYHGSGLLNGMMDYKLRILDYDRKYMWKFITMFDQKHRNKMVGVHIDFDRVDVVMVNDNLNHFAMKPNPTRCSVCFAFNHISKVCPFRDAPGQNPGFQAGERSRGLVYDSPEICLNWNAQRCFDNQCKRIHKCRGCNGNVPQSVCAKYGFCAGGGGLRQLSNPPPNFGQPPPQVPPTQRN